MDTFALDLSMKHKKKASNASSNAHHPANLAHQLLHIEEQLFAHTSAIETLKERLDIPQLAQLLNANLFTYFPTMHLLKDEVSSLRKQCETLEGRMVAMEE